jgi:flagellar basal body-associated protein FliL
MAADIELEKSAATARKKGKPLGLVLSVLAIGAAAGVGATLAIPRPPASDSNSNRQVETLEFFAIPEVKANLANSAGRHFCMVDLQINFRTKNLDSVRMRLGLRSESSVSVEPLGGAIGTAARDRLILLLASKGMEDLEGREKKDLLKKEIEAELAPIVFPDKDGEIEAVLFKDFLIQ